MIKLCIFDLDGTLLDTLRSIRHFLNLALTENGLPELDLENVRRFVGNGVKNLARRSAEYFGIDVNTDLGEELSSRVAARLTELYNAEPVYLTEIYDGVEKLISSLRARGIRLAVLSNKPHSAVVPIIEEFFGGAFDEVRGGMPSVPLKPMPDAALDIASRLAVKPCETAFIGDSEVDVETGRAFGAGLTLGVSWGFRDKEVLVQAGADVVADNCGEVLQAILAK
jgi:phosphoglycolate phosphatase